MTNLLPSYADCLEIWDSKPPGSRRVCPGLYSDCFSFTYPSHAIVYGNCMGQLQSYFIFWIMPTQRIYVFLTSVRTKNFALNSINTLVFVLEEDLIFCYTWIGFLQFIQFILRLLMLPMFPLCPSGLKFIKIKPFSLKNTTLPFKSLLLIVNR